MNALNPLRWLIAALFFPAAFYLFNKSSSTTSNLTQTDNSNLAAAEGGIALRESTLVTIDPGSFDLAGKAVDAIGDAILQVRASQDSALDFAGSASETALDFARSSSDSAFDFARRTFDTSLGVVTDTIGKSAKQTTDALAGYQSQARDSLAQVVTLAAKANTSSVQQLTENVFKYGMIGLTVLGIGAAAAFAYSRKKAA